MEAFILGSLGQHSSLVLGLTLVAVLLARRSIRKRHIVILLIVAVASFLAFFSLLLWSFTWNQAQGPALALQMVLKVLAALTVGCASAIGFTFVLKGLGLSSLTEKQPKARIRQRR